MTRLTQQTRPIDYEIDAEVVVMGRALVLSIENPRPSDSSESSRGGGSSQNPTHLVAILFSLTLATLSKAVTVPTRRHAQFV